MGKFNLELFIVGLTYVGISLIDIVNKLTAEYGSLILFNQAYNCKI